MTSYAVWFIDICLGFVLLLIVYCFVLLFLIFVLVCFTYVFFLEFGLFAYLLVLICLMGFLVLFLLFGFIVYWFDWLGCLVFWLWHFGLLCCLLVSTAWLVGYCLIAFGCFVDWLIGLLGGSVYCYYLFRFCSFTVVIWCVDWIIWLVCDCGVVLLVCFVANTWVGVTSDLLVGFVVNCYLLLIVLLLFICVLRCITLFVYCVLLFVFLLTF